MYWIDRQVGAGESGGGGRRELHLQGGEYYLLILLLATSGVILNRQNLPPPLVSQMFLRKEAKIFTQGEHVYKLHVCKFLK